MSSAGRRGVVAVVRRRQRAPAHTTNQWLKWKISAERTPLSAWACPSHEGRAHQMLMRVNIRCYIRLSITTLRTCNKQLPSIILRRCCHFGVCNRSYSVPPTVSLHFYETGGAGTLFANSQTYRNAIPLRPIAL